MTTQRPAVSRSMLVAALMTAGALISLAAMVINLTEVLR